MADVWIDVKDVIVKGSGFLRLVPTTASDFTITAVGNPINLTYLTAEKANYPDLSPKQEELTKELTTGVVVKVPKVTVYVSAVDGYKAGEKLEYSFECKSLISLSKWNAITANPDMPFFAVKGRGFDVSNTHLGFQYLLGYLKPFTLETKYDFVEVDIVLVGGFVHKLEGVNLSAINAKLQGSITPVGKSSITVPAITEAELTALLNGKIVDKDAT